MDESLVISTYLGVVDRLKYYGLMLYIKNADSKTMYIKDVADSETSYYLAKCDTIREVEKFLEGWDVCQSRIQK